MDVKTLTRKQALARRDAVPAEDRARKSARACERALQKADAAVAAGLRLGAGAPSTPALGAAALSGAGSAAVTVAAYAAMRSEVDVTAFLDAAYARGWRVCLPCMVACGSEDSRRASRMVFFDVPSWRLHDDRPAWLDYPARAFDARALASEGWREVPPQDIDIAVVPLVAFDGDNNRLGYGGGNYDRFLPQLRPDALVMGVAFEEQRVPAVPLESHDRPLPHIVVA